MLLETGSTSNTPSTAECMENGIPSHSNYEKGKRVFLHVFKSVHFNSPQLFCTVPKMYCIKDARLSKIHGKSSSESQICKSSTSTVARLDCMQPRVSIIWNYKPSLFFFVSHSPCTPSTKAAARVTYSAYKDESIS